MQHTNIQGHSILTVLARVKKKKTGTNLLLSFLFADWLVGLLGLNPIDYIRVIKAPCNLYTTNQGYVNP